MSDQLQEAVTKASEELTNETNTEGTSASKVEETKVEGTDSKKEPEIDARTLQALNLLDALEDPKQATKVVSNLMQQLGMQAPETRQEKRDQEKTIRDIVKEELGPDYAFMADKLSAAMEKVLSIQEQKFVVIEQNKEAQAAAREYENWVKESEVSEEEAGALMKLADEMPFSGKGTLTGYLNKLLKLHRNEVSEQKAEIAKRQKQQENFEKRPKTMGVEANEDRVFRGSKTISIKEAVEAAARGERLD